MGLIQQTISCSRCPRTQTLKAAIQHETWFIVSMPVANQNGLLVYSLVNEKMAMRDEEGDVAVCSPGCLSKTVATWGADRVQAKRNAAVQVVSDAMDLGVQVQPSSFQACSDCAMSAFCHTEKKCLDPNRQGDRQQGNVTTFRTCRDCASPLTCINAKACKDKVPGIVYTES